MTSLQQRAELHRQIWAIANDVRGRSMVGISNNTSLVRSSIALSVKTFPATLRPVMIASTMLR